MLNIIYLAFLNNYITSYNQNDENNFHKIQ